MLLPLRTTVNVLRGEKSYRAYFIKGIKGPTYKDIYVRRRFNRTR